MGRIFNFFFFYIFVQLNINPISLVQEGFVITACWRLIFVCLIPGGGVTIVSKTNWYMNDANSPVSTSSVHLFLTSAGSVKFYNFRLPKMNPAIVFESALFSLKPFQPDQLETGQTYSVEESQTHAGICNIFLIDHFSYSRIGISL